MKNKLLVGLVLSGLLVGIAHAKSNVVRNDCECGSLTGIWVYYSTDKSKDDDNWSKDDDNWSKDDDNWSKDDDDSKRYCQCRMTGSGTLSPNSAFQPF